MLEDLKRVEAEAARKERLRQQEQNEYDAALRQAFAAYAPILGQFCKESGWVVRDKGISLMNDSSFNYGPPSHRCLLVFVEGPDKPFSNREYSGTTCAGMNLFLWCETGGLFVRKRRLLCATSCTMLHPFDGEFHQRWTGIDHGRLETALRGAFGLFGSRASTVPPSAG